MNNTPLTNKKMTVLTKNLTKKRKKALKGVEEYIKASEDYHNYLGMQGDVLKNPPLHIYTKRISIVITRT